MSFPALAASLLIAAAVTCSCASHGGHPAKETGWRPIFDGRSTAGWQMVGPGELRLEQGELVSYGGMGLLWYTPEKFGHCQIRVVFKFTTKDDNSGVFIRIPNPPKDPWEAVNHGYEVQLANGSDDHHNLGCLYSISQAKHMVAAPLHEWSTMLITLDGPHTVVTVNGQLVTDFREGDPVPEKTRWFEPDRGLRPESGYLGLQNHGEPARVHFREVSVRPL